MYPERDTPSMTSMYRDKQKVMDMRLKKEVEKQIVGKVVVPPDQAQKYTHKSSLMADPILQLEPELQPKPKEENLQYFRSKRQVAQRVKDGLETKVFDLEGEKLDLMEKINDSLVELDKVNQEKNELQNKLIQQIGFVRDLQKQSFAGDDLPHVVDGPLKDEFKREKQLNIQLKEALKKCEIERLKIIEQLQKLLGEKDIAIMQTNGMRYDFVATKQNIEDLILNQRDILGKIQATKNRIDHLNGVTYQYEGSIKDLDEQVQILHKERNHIQDKYIDVETKYNDTVYEMGNARRQQEYGYRENRQLFAAKHLLRTLDCAVERNRKQTFDEMFYIMRQDEQHYGKILMFRKLIMNFRRRKLSKGFQAWIHHGLKHLQRIQQNRQITHVMKKKDNLKYFFEAFKIGIKQAHRDRIDMYNRVGQLLHHGGNIQTRMLRFAFQKWKDNSDSSKDGMKTLFKKCLKKRSNIMSEAFNKWKLYNDKQDFHMRLNEYAMRMTIQQFTQSMFYEWRAYVQKRKIKKHSLKVRAFKNLKAYKQKQRQLQQQTIALMKGDKEYNKFLLASAFGALKVQKEEAKFMIMNEELEMNEGPAILEANEHIKELQKKGADRSCKKAVQAISSPFGKLLAQYFDHWKNLATSTNKNLNTKIKDQIIRTYKNKLRRAFDLWKKNKDGQQICQQQMEFDEVQSNTEAMVEDLKKTEAVNKQHADRSSHKAKRKTDNIIEKQYKKKLRVWMHRWRDHCDKKTHVEGKVGKVIFLKYRQRMIRQGFNQFRDGIHIRKQDFLNEQNLVYVKNRLNYRLKKRVFNKLRGFSSNHGLATNYVRKIFNRFTKGNLGVAFKIWQSYSHNNREYNIRQRQDELINTLRDMHAEHGMHQDENYKIQQKNKMLTKSLQNQARKTLVRYFELQVNHTTLNYFQRWKSHGTFMTDREIILKNIQIKMNKNFTRQAFRIWRLGHSQYAQELMVEEMEYESKKASEINEHLDRYNVQKERQKVEKGRNIRMVQSQAFYHKKKFQNIIVNLIAKNSAHTMIRKDRMILRAWHEYTQRKKRGILAIKKGIEHSLLHCGIAAIKDLSRNEKLGQLTEKKSKRTFALFKKFWTKRAFNLWRTSSFHNTQMVMLQIQQEQSEFNQAHLEQKEIIHEEFIRKKDRFRRVDHKREAFEIWYDKIQQKKLFKAAHNEFLNKQQNIRKRWAVQKWNKRMKKTLQFRHSANCTLRIALGTSKHLVFAAWREQHLKEKRLRNTLVNTFQSLKHFHLKPAFDQIAEYGTTKEKLKLMKQNSIAKNFCERYIQVRIGFVKDKFVLWRLQIQREDQFKSIKKGIVGKAIVNRQRDLFMIWKKKTEMARCFEDVDNDGPLAKELRDQQQEIRNLEQLLMDEGIPKKDIQQALKDCDKDYQAKVEKSVCRMFCADKHYVDEQGVPTLQLLPQCLDKWRSYVKMRKLWRHWLKWANNRSLKPYSHAAIAFDKWKYQRDDEIKQLMKLKRDDLNKIAVKQGDQLKDYSDYIKDNQDVIDEYTDQRAVLMGALRGSQKLALANTKHKMQFAKMKAFNRMKNHNNRYAKEMLQHACAKNIEIMDQLKGKIAELEAVNDTLARDNEDLRSGAMDGIHMARTVDDLNNERELLSVDLADKALAIRKLLEDNNNLSVRLKSAQDEANRIINISHNASQIKPHRDQSPIFYQ